MPLSLRIENVDQLPDGGPTTYKVDRRGLDIGRDPFMDWTLPDSERFISGKHCEIHFRDGAYWLHDVSTNGTTINGRGSRLTEPHKIADGDRIYIGGYIVAASVSGPEVASAAPAQGAGGGGDIWGVADAAEAIDRQSFQRQSARPGEGARPIHADLAEEHIEWGVGATSSPSESDAADLDWGVPAGGKSGGASSGDDFGWDTTPASPPPQPSPPSSPPPAEPSGGEAPPAWAPPAPEPEAPAAPPPATEGADDGAPADWRVPPPDPNAPVATPPPEQTPPPAESFAPPPEPPAPPAESFAPPPEPPAPPADAFAPLPEQPAPPADAFAPPPTEEEPLVLSNPVNVPPSAPAPAPEASAPGGAPGAFVAAFERGAGMPAGAVSGRSDEQLAEELGGLFRTTAQNLQAMLMARAETKSAMRSSERTMIGALENNPLKFSPSPEDAMRIMFGEKTRSYLDARQTIDQSFGDLQKHQVYTFAAMQQALSALIGDLDPETIAGATSKDGGLASIVSSRRAKLWDTYVERFKSKSAHHERGMVDAFMILFAEMYDRQG